MSKVMENCHFPTGLGGTGDNFAQFLGHTLLLKLMLDKSFSPEEYQDVKFQLVPIASAGGDDILLATTIDGAIHALNKKTGIISWSFTDKTKPLISGNFPVASTETFDKQAWYLNSSPNFLVEPLYPGGLYTYVPGGTLQVMFIARKMENNIDFSFIENASFHKKSGISVSSAMAGWDDVPWQEDI